jgi:hypothetical protein
MVADVQMWLDNPVSNFGWMIRGDETATRTARRYNSRENPAAGSRPRLIVQYMPVGTSTESAHVPKNAILAQNHPNPFSGSTRIGFTLPDAQLAKLTVFDLLGRQVASLSKGVLAAGAHEFVFDATGLPDGVYLYRLEAGSTSESARRTQTRQLVIMN